MSHDSLSQPSSVSRRVVLQRTAIVSAGVAVWSVPTIRAMAAPGAAGSPAPGGGTPDPKAGGIGGAYVWTIPANATTTFQVIGGGGLDSLDFFFQLLGGPQVQFDDNGGSGGFSGSLVTLAAAGGDRTFRFALHDAVGDYDFYSDNPFHATGNGPGGSGTFQVAFGDSGVGSAPPATEKGDRSNGTVVINIG